MDLSKLTINILVSVLFASIFLIVFFFTYVKNVEKQVVINNVEFTVNSLIDNLLPFISPENKKKMYNYLDSLNLVVDVQNDNDTADSNSKLLKTATHDLIIFAVIIIIIIGIIYIINRDHLKPFVSEILAENIIIVCFIGLTEFTFLHLFASKFISSNPNLIKYNLLKVLDIKNS